MGNPNNALRALEASRKDLLDLTTRNRLLSTPRQSTRAKTLEIVDEMSDQVARMLMNEGRMMSFLPASEPDEIDAGDSSDILGQMGQPEEDAVDEHGVAARHSDTKLQTVLSDAKLQKKLLSLLREAQTHEEEQGVNILYLSLGFLKWYDSPSSDLARFAPLILLPARLVRNESGGRIRLEVDDESLNTNLSLQSKLRTDFGIGLPELPDREDLVPSQYFVEVRQHIQGQPRWEVLENDMVLGVFSFAKFLMYRDLDPKSWPNPEGLGGYNILSGLLVEGFESVPPLWPDDERVEDHVKPLDQVYVLDADSSQTRAIEEVKAGRSMVIQGPPGTGKSQTIANLVAASVKQGKRVLFVAEKMAALEVVYRRMENIELGQLCLELHSRKANKKQVLGELEKTLAVSGASTAKIDGHLGRLEDAQCRLNQHVDLLHTPLEPSGLTPFRVLGELTSLAGRGVHTSNLTLQGSKTWTHEAFEAKRSLLAVVCKHIERLGVPIDNPWCGVGLKQNILPSDRKRLEERLTKISCQISELEQSLRDLMALLGCDPATSMTEASQVAITAAILGNVPAGDLSCLIRPAWREDRRSIRRLLDQGEKYASLRKQLETVFQEEAWDWDPSATRKLLEEHGHSLFRVFRRSYRDARQRFKRATLPPWKGSRLDELEALQALANGREIKLCIEGAEDQGVEVFGCEWRGVSSPWARLAGLWKWVEDSAQELTTIDFLRVLGQGTDPRELAASADRIGNQIEACHAGLEAEADFLKLDLTVSMEKDTLADISLVVLRDRVGKWCQSLDKLPEWIKLSRSLESIRGDDLPELALKLFTGELSALHAEDQFCCAHYETVIRAAMEQHSSLANFSGHDHDILVDDFKRLDLQRINLAIQEVASAHSLQVPSGGGGVGEMGVLLHEFGKKRRHLPIRKLLDKAGNAIQRIKPVFMMSPVSISQFLSPGHLEFDLLLIDEASQVKPVDAFGAILRSKQIVVVGDDKQLPPTNFFGRSIVDDEEEDEEFAAPGDLESILSLCGAKGMPSCMLRWHYRSQHESLIAVSNHEFYGDRLCVVPSPCAQTSDLGVKFHHIEDGFFERGGSRANRVEAKRVAQAAIAHARANPQQSLGIGTFSAPQKDAIYDELEYLWRTEEDVRSFFNPGRSDPFFVKNLETIQGDERDVIFISVGYGQDQDGRFHMRFGPLNNDGGERRLNVLISRARKRCEVFTSIRARDMDLSKVKGLGVAALKTYLRFAEDGQMDVPKSTGRSFDSPFEEEVCEALQRLGHTVGSQIGTAGFFIDLAVQDPNNPGRYVLGVECDGATYHSSRSARDRDRLRQEVLESRGWIIHRIWSTDWFQEPEQQIRKTQTAIDEAILEFEQRDQQGLSSHNSTSKRSPNAPYLPQPESGSELSFDPPAHTGVSCTLPSSIAEQASNIRPYFSAHVVVPITDHPENLSVGAMSRIVTEIVDAEGPIHEDEVARRVTSFWGLARTGRRIQAAVVRGLLCASGSGQVAKAGSFYDITTRTGPVPIRSRANAPSPGLRKPECLPPSEIRTAIHEVIHHCVGADRENTTRQVSRMFGFKSTSSRLAATIEAEIERMVAKGTLQENRGMLSFGNTVEAIKGEP